MLGHSTEPFAGFVDSQRFARINQPETLAEVLGYPARLVRQSALLGRTPRHAVRDAPIDSGAVLFFLGMASGVTVFTIVQFSLDVGGMPGWIWGVSCPVDCWRNRQDRFLLNSFVFWSSSRCLILSFSCTRTDAYRRCRVARDLRISGWSRRPARPHAQPPENGRAGPVLVEYPAPLYPPSG